MRGQLRLPVVRWTSGQVGLLCGHHLSGQRHPGHEPAVLRRKAPPRERGHRRGMQHTAGRSQGAVREARPVPPLCRPALEVGWRRTHHQESRHAHGGLAPPLLLLGPPDIWLGLDQNWRHVRRSLNCGLHRCTADRHKHCRRYSGQQWPMRACRHCHRPQLGCDSSWLHACHDTRHQGHGSHARCRNSR